MLSHVLLSLLVFEHGFIQIRFGSFEFSYTISFLLNFTRYLFSEIFLRYLLQFFFVLMRNITRWMLDTEVKVFHKSISYFIKWPWNCISFPERKFSLCILPLRVWNLLLDFIYIWVIYESTNWSMISKNRLVLYVNMVTKL